MSNVEAYVVQLLFCFEKSHCNVYSHYASKCFPPVEVLLQGTLPLVGYSYCCPEAIVQYQKQMCYRRGILWATGGMTSLRGGIGYKCANTLVGESSSYSCPLGYYRGGQNPLDRGFHDQRPYCITNSVECLCAHKQSIIEESCLSFFSRECLKYETKDECTYAVANYLTELSKCIPIGVLTRAEVVSSSFPMFLFYFFLTLSYLFRILVLCTFHPKIAQFPIKLISILKK